MQEGLPAYHADALVKEAGWMSAGLKGIGAAARAFGSTAKGVGTAAKGIGNTALQGGAKAFNRGAVNAARWGAKGRYAAQAKGATPMAQTLGKTQAAIGSRASQIAKGTRDGMRNFAAAPGQTAWQGAKNFGAGAIMMQGKGVAGGLGKAQFVNGMIG